MNNPEADPATYLTAKYEGWEITHFARQWTAYLPGWGTLHGQTAEELDDRLHRWSAGRGQLA